MKQEELIRERDFYRAKLKETVARAELVKRDQDLSKRLAENANRGTYRPRPKRFN